MRIFCLSLFLFFSYFRVSFFLFIISFHSSTYFSLILRLYNFLLIINLSPPLTHPIYSLLFLFSFFFMFHFLFSSLLLLSILLFLQILNLLITSFVFFRALFSMFYSLLSLFPVSSLISFHSFLFASFIFFSSPARSVREVQISFGPSSNNHLVYKCF